MSTTATERRTEVEFDENAYPNICDAYRHEDGSITYIVYDDDGSSASPRECDGNISTLIQVNSIAIDIDDDDVGLGEARDRWDWTRYPSMVGGTRSDRAIKACGRDELMTRYLAMFDPEIEYYCDHWSAGSSYGWGYVTRENWVKAMGEDPYTGDVTPETGFDQEVDLYRQWANGEVYGAHHVTVGDPIVKFWDHGAYIDGWSTEEDDCWGFLGYPDHRDIAKQFTDSPITEVLA